MSGRLSFVLVAAMLAFLPGAGFAQQPEAESDRVTVTGRSTEDAIKSFVDAIASPSSKGQDQMARWDRKVCPGLMGLKPDLARGFLDRLAQRAASIGLEVGEPGCRANILIVVTPNPDEVARDLFNRFGSRIGRYDERGLETQGRRALDRFVNSDAPVRWWHVANTVTRDGKSLHTDDSTPAGDRAGLSGRPGFTAMTGNSTRITRMTRQDFASAFLIVDASRMAKINFNALADYLAMVSLAQLDPEADASGLPSILNLFAARDAAGPTMASMTDWDLAYLRGLYSVERVSGSAKRQQSDIADSIAKELGKEGAE